MTCSNGQFQSLLDLLAKKKKLALAVSGGSDSMGLMHVVALWAKEQNLLDSICVLTVDHGLRKNSDAEAKQVCKWADELGLPCHILTWQHDGPVSGIQEKARAGRYHLMADWCRDNGFDGVITAHQSDDQAETMLMRLARGSGVDGLSSMAARSEVFGLAVYRPLLNVSRDDLRNVLEAAGHKWLEDPANQNEKFERVRLRGAMGDFKNAGIDQAALSLSVKRLRRARSALETMTDQFMATGVTIFNTGHCEIDRTLLNTQPDEIALRALSRLLMWAGGGDVAVSMAKVERLMDALAGAGDKHTLAGAQLAVRKNTLIIGREYGRIEPSLQQGVMHWDNRFAFTTPQNVQPYGLFIDDDERERPPELPYFVACSLPVLFDGTGELIVPHLHKFERGNIGLSIMPCGVLEVVEMPVKSR